MKKILIVHDHANIRELLADKLAAEGYLVVPISRSALAKEMISVLDPDLVILKLDEDKRAVLDEVKRQLPSLPILALTTIDRPEKDLPPSASGVYVIRDSGFDGLPEKVIGVLRGENLSTQRNT